MIQIEIAAEFPLGRVVSTANAVEKLKAEDVIACIQRHARCDWGDLTEEDATLNDLSLQDEGRLLSAYSDSNGVKFWIITEWDRSVTTVLLPEDY